MSTGIRVVTRPSRDRVEQVFRSLRETFRAFDVYQTSAALAPTAYETVLGDGLVDAAVRVENAAGEVLAVDDGGWREPRVRFDHDGDGDPVESAQSAFADLTGVVSLVTGLSEVSIVTIHDETDVDRPPRFLLDARFLARYESGDPRSGVAWCDQVEEGPGDGPTLATRLSRRPRSWT